ncbi:hypothetical protein NL676_011893 [Syzygium grande]|nr:hypothetical protein NL676_011893 [Syzygium grande]
MTIFSLCLVAQPQALSLRLGRCLDDLAEGRQEFVSSFKEEEDGGGNYDYTGDLPDDCLAHVFHFLGMGDRKQCSVVCRRWLYINEENRHRLSLNAQVKLLSSFPFIFCCSSNSCVLVQRERVMVTSGEPLKEDRASLRHFTPAAEKQSRTEEVMRRQNQ